MHIDESKRRLIYLKITNRCNLRCPHCYIPEYKGDMRIEILRRAIEFFSQSEKPRIYLFHGGEPILAGREYLFNSLDLMRQLDEDAICVIQTNLHYNVFEYIDFFKALDGVGTSMDEGRDSNLLYKNIDNLLSEGIFVRVNITLTDNYIERGWFEKDIKFIEERNIPFRISSYEFSLGRINSVNYLTHLKLLYEYMNHPLCEDKLSCGMDKIVVGGNCAKQGMRTVDIDGEVYVCQHMAGYKQFSLGNIMDRNFTDDLHSKKLGMRIFTERQKRLILETECGQCNNYLLCEGGCVANNIFMNFHKLKTEDDFIMVRNTKCEDIKNFYKNT